MQDPTCKVSATSRVAIENIIRVTQQAPLTLPTFDDIITDRHFYDLIMSSFESVGFLPMYYFDLTPVDAILPGR